MNEFTDKSVKFVVKSQEYYEYLEQTNEQLLSSLAMKNETLDEFIALKNKEIERLEQANERLRSLLASKGETFDQLLALKDEEIQKLTKDLKDSNKRTQTLEAMSFEDGNLLSHARNIALKEEREEGNEEDTDNDREKRGAVDKEKRVVIKEEKTENAIENTPKKTEVGDNNGLDFKTNKNEKRGRKQHKKNKERRRFSFSPPETSESSRGIWASGSSDGKVWSSQSSNQNFDYPDWRSKDSGDYGIWRNRVKEWRAQEEERKARYQIWVRENDSCGEEKDQYQNEDFPASNSSDNDDDSESNGSDDCEDFGREDDHDDDHDDDDDNDDDNDYNYNSYVDMVYENDDFNYISDF